MSPEQRTLAEIALARYGARLTKNDAIAKGDKELSVRLEVQKGRLRMVGGGANVLATYPATKIEKGVSDFVEKFWFWKPA